MNTFKCLCMHRAYMAKPYWRVKRDGKWTWVPAEVIPLFTTQMITAIKPYVGCESDD